MRKIVCLLIVALMCMTMAVSAFAAENTFVPSISYKDGPEVEKAEQNGETVTACVVVTSLKEASQKTTDVTQAAGGWLYGAASGRGLCDP